MFALESMCALQGILGLEWGILTAVPCPTVGILTRKFLKCQNSPGFPTPPPPSGGKH
jgi:hypothetical protein